MFYYFYYLYCLFYYSMLCFIISTIHSIISITYTILFSYFYYLYCLFYYYSMLYPIILHSVLLFLSPKLFILSLYALFDYSLLCSIISTMYFIISITYISFPSSFYIPSYVSL